MKSPLRVFILACLALLSLPAFGQGIGWTSNFESADSKMVRDANGDIFVASTVELGGYVHPKVDRYSANGVLIKHYSFYTGYGLFNSSRVLAIRIESGKVLFVVSMNDNPMTKMRTSRFSYDIAANTIGVADITSSGMSMRSTSCAYSQTTYCLVATRSDNKCVAQVRSIASDAVLHEIVNTDVNMNGCVIRGADVYATHGTQVISALPRFITYLVSATTHSSYYVTIPEATSQTLGAMSNDGKYLYIATGFYHSGNSEYDLYCRSFDLGTHSFQAPYHVIDTSVSDQTVLLYPLGDQEVILFGSRNAYGLHPNGTVLFTGVTNSYYATAQTDLSGNVVALISKAGHLNMTRYFKTGLIRNSLELTDMQRMPMDLTLDAGGVIRCLFYTNPAPFEQPRTVAQINPASLTLPGPYTVGGDTLIGTIDIGGPAPLGGATFSLFSNNAAATVPPTVTVPQGEHIATFTINTTAVAANAKPSISARYDGLILQANFDLAAPLIESATASPQVQYGGVNIVGTLHLTGKAPVGGKIVSLTSSNTAKATVPASTTIAAGANAKTFLIATVPTLINASSVITATTGAVSKTVFVAVNAPIFQSAALGATTIKGGTGTTITLTLNAKAPTGYTVTLLSGATTFVQLPSSYAVPAGAATANVPVTTSPVTTSTPITLVAYRGPYVKPMTLTLTP